MFANGLGLRPGSEVMVAVAREGVLGCAAYVDAGLGRVTLRMVKGAIALGGGSKFDDVDDVHVGASR